MIAEQISSSLVGMCAPDLITLASTLSPEAVAIEAPCGALTYGALEARVGAMSTRLQADGVVPGALVAVCLPRSMDQIVATLAAWRLGAAYLPLDPAWPEARLAALVADLHSCRAGRHAGARGADRG